MNTSFKEVEAIANTLPIGLYAKRRIPTVVKQDEDTSCYNPFMDTISISYPQVAKAINNIPDDADKEASIRATLYHEVSHAILTCPDACRWGVTQQFNIVEDERIETVMNDYYLNVDFPSNVYNINGIHSNADLTQPTSAMSAFYQLIRFHVGDDDLLDKTEKLISKYASLNSNWTYRWNDYQNDIDSLYDEVERRFYQQNQSQSGNGQQNQGQSGNGQQNQSQSGNGQQNQGQSGNGQQNQGQSGNGQQNQGQNGNGQQNQGQSGNGQQNQGQNGNGQQNQGQNGNQGDNYATDITGQPKQNQGQNGNGQQNHGQNGNSQQNQGQNQSDNGQGQGQSGNGQNQKKAFKVDKADFDCSTNSLTKVFSNKCKPMYDDDMYKQFDMIIANFNKKNNSGCAMTGYSGVLNPRLAGRTDYKFFEKKSSVNGANKFGTFHLNLFLDNSGSFEYNGPIVNAMLGALIRLEKKNKNFSFNVVHCGVGEELIENPEHYALTCNDGTSLDYEADAIYKKLQKPNTYNYNIVLYDGYCGDYRYNDAFKAFNHANCTIISDGSNREHIEQYAPSAKAIITNDYTNNLRKNVMDTLARAFR